MLQNLRTDRAILFSTHIIADVEAISDRVLIIHQGQILGNGTVKELAKLNGIPESNLEQIFAHLIKNHAPIHEQS